MLFQLIKTKINGIKIYNSNKLLNLTISFCAHLLPWKKRAEKTLEQVLCIALVYQKKLYIYIYIHIIHLMNYITILIYPVKAIAADLLITTQLQTLKGIRT